MSSEEAVLDPSELDPSAPIPGDEETFEGAGEATNNGLDGRGDLTPDADEGLEGLESPQAGVAELKVDITKARAFLKACMTSNPRVRYGLGAKIKAGQEPGRDFKAVDCSGFVREAIRRSTNLGGKFPDGSVVQHDWVKKKGFKQLDRSLAGTRDGAVRIAFLRPQDAPSGIGHVVLVYDAGTLESHGGVGPNARPWTGKGWQAKAFVYMLSPAGSNEATS